MANNPKTGKKIVTMPIEEALRTHQPQQYTSLLQQDNGKEKKPISGMNQMYVVGLRQNKGKKNGNGNALDGVKVRVEIGEKEKTRGYGKDYGWEEDLRNLDNNLPMHRIFEH